MRVDDQKLIILLEWPYTKNIDLASSSIENGRVLMKFLEVKERYATALNRA